MSQKPTPVPAYTSPHQFEPLLPLSDVQALRERGDEVARQSARLLGMVHPATLQPLRELLRAMNSYYSNRIEGQNTHPLRIEQALHHDFSKQPDVARRQRLAMAHIQAEIALEQRVEAGADPLASSFLRDAHAELYGRLSGDDRASDDARVVEPGAIRSEEVQVHRHVPPAAASLPAFLARFDRFFARHWTSADLLQVAAAAHHRMAWVHPFLDGNGRAIRLQTHCVLWRLSGGLWSVNRGLARQRADYYRLLSEADMARQGDLDGRGNLSERMLAQWCRFFVALCEDQVSFMAKMLNLADMKQRIAALVAIRGHQPGRATVYRPEVVLPLHHLFAAGPVSRGEFAQMTGLGERTARRIVSALLADGLLASDHHRAELRFALPLDSLMVLLPDLYPEAATQVIDA